MKTVTGSDSHGEREEEPRWSLDKALNGEADSSYAGRDGPERYPYADVATAFL